MYHDRKVQLTSWLVSSRRLTLLPLGVLAFLFAPCDDGTVEAQQQFAGPPTVAATYFGGPGEEVIMDMAILPSGDIVAVGWSSSSRLPLGAGNVHRNQGSFDAFVIRLDSNMSELISIVLLAGNREDRATTLAIAPDGTVVVGGLTNSPDFPVSDDAFDKTLGGFRDGFIAIVDTARDVPDDERIVYSTFIGGSGEDGCVELKVASSGLVSAVGFTASDDFPTTAGAYEELYQGGRYDSFLLQLHPSPDELPKDHLIYSTFLGGTGPDAFPTADSDGLLLRLQSQDMALDASGLVTMVNVTNSADFPITEGAFQTIHRGGRDVCIIQIQPDPDLGKEQLVYGTFLGGSNTDAPSDVAIDREGNIVVAGWTFSGFPTTPGALSRRLAGEDDVFLSVIKPDLNLEPKEQLLYSTLIGGPRSDFATAVAVDGNGRVFLTGATQFADFPVTPGAIKNRLRNAWDNFLMILDLDLEMGTGAILYSTFFGGTGGEEYDCADTLAIDNTGHVFLAGFTDTCWFPARAEAFQDQCGGGWDGYLLRLSFDSPSLFRRGDCNDDGKVDIADAVCILNWLFAGEAAPGCVAATNTNGDAAANITDATYLLNHLFVAGPAPVEPFPDCGAADTGLGCETNCQ